MFKTPQTPREAMEAISFVAMIVAPLYGILKSREDRRRAKEQETQDRLNNVEAECRKFRDAAESAMNRKENEQRKEAHQEWLENQFDRERKAFIREKVAFFYQNESDLERARKKAEHLWALFEEEIKRDFLESNGKIYHKIPTPANF